MYNDHTTGSNMGCVVNLDKAAVLPSEEYEHSFKHSCTGKAIVLISSMSKIVWMFLTTKLPDGNDCNAHAKDRLLVCNHLRVSSPAKQLLQIFCSRNCSFRLTICERRTDLDTDDQSISIQGVHLSFPIYVTDRERLTRDAAECVRMLVLPASSVP